MKFEISSWRGARVDVRTYLLGGAIKVLLSYESVDVVVGEYWLLGHIKDENGIATEMDLVGFTPRRRIGFRMELIQGATPICEGSCRLTFLKRQKVWNNCRSCKVRVGSNGNLLWEASVLFGRKKGREDVPRSFHNQKQNGEAEQRGSYLEEEGIKWIEGDCLYVATSEGSYEGFAMDNVVGFCLIMLEAFSERDLESDLYGYERSNTLSIQEYEHIRTER
ncbi:hypothetical protein Tco_0000016 [Tanacetum coccineum]